MRSHKPRKKVNAGKKIGEKRCPKDSLIQNGSPCGRKCVVLRLKSPAQAFWTLRRGFVLKRAIDPVRYTWPLSERSQHFELGQMLHCAADLEGLGAREPSSGWWECNLADNSLSWTGGVYTLFGFEPGAALSRDDALGRYTEQTRVILERIREDAIRQKCGFTLDAELKPLDGHSRWLRIVAAPDIANDRVVRLHGLKFML